MMDGRFASRIRIITGREQKSVRGLVSLKEEWTMPLVRRRRWKHGKILLARVGLADNPSTLFINSAAWRYVHRLIATGINCSPETVDVVTEDDLNLLCSIEQGKPINWFHRFSDKFLAMKSEFGAFDFVGCTSVITAIAEMCNYRFYCMPTEYKKLDMHMIKKLTILAQDASVGTPREESEQEEDRSHLERPPSEIRGERVRTAPERPPNERKKKKARKAKKELWTGRR